MYKKIPFSIGNAIKIDIYISLSLNIASLFQYSILKLNHFYLWHMRSEVLELRELTCVRVEKLISTGANFQFARVQ